MTDDDGRIRIWVNSGAKMSRGKYAAAAIHAALTAAGVHPGVPVIVLGGQRDDIEKMQTVIHDAGRTEVEPGTATAGTDYVFENAHAPTDDEREALRNLLYQSNVVPFEAIDPITDRILERFHRSEVPEPQGEPSLPLDPQPWAFMSDQVFGVRSATDKGFHSVSGAYYVFQPRAGYEQDRARYEDQTTVHEIRRQR